MRAYRNIHSSGRATNLLTSFMSVLSAHGKTSSITFRVDLIRSSVVNSNNLAWLQMLWFDRQGKRAVCARYRKRNPY